MKVTATCYPPGLEMRQEVVGAIKKSITSWVLDKLDTESLEERLVQREPLSGAEYRALLNKINDILIDINAHLETCSRHYNALFERTLGINFIGIVYKQYDKMVSNRAFPLKVGFQIGRQSLRGRHCQRQNSCLGKALLCCIVIECTWRRTHVRLFN